MSVVTKQPIELSQFIPDITTALLTYNRLRWWRSRTGQYGLYEQATADTAQAAALTGALTTPHQISGKTLSFMVDGVTQVDVVFTDPDPVTTAQAVAEIIGVTALVVPTDDSGKLKLTTATTGTSASIEILDGDANPFLGFSEGDAAVGQGVDSTLASGTHEYLFTDQNSDPEFWYRTELIHDTTMVTAGLGVPFIAGSPAAVSKAQTIVCYMRLSDMGGKPVVCRKISFSNPFLPNTVVDQNLTWGVFRHYTEMITNSDGYAEIRLLRGMEVDVSVEGSNFIRRIKIPTTGDSVDLLDASLVAEDEFGIQEPDIDFAVRTT